MTAITILGRGDDWKELDRPHGELWGTATCLLIPGLGDMPFSKVFAFDSIDDNGIIYSGVPHTNYSLRRAIEFAKTLKIPVVSTFPYADEIYPVRDIVQKCKWGLMMNTVSRMFAYAVSLEYSPIFIFGIGGRSRPDYELARPSLMTWHGLAIGKGLDVRMGRGALRWLYKQDVVSIPDVPAQTKWHEERECLPSR